MLTGPDMRGSTRERAAEAAADHGITLEVVKPFAALWWPDRPVWNRDLDQVADTAWLADLAGRAGLTLDRVRAMTLDAPRRRFGRGSGDASLILSAGIYRRTRIRHALQICPRCLSAGDCAVIVKTVATWIEDWPRRFFTAASLPPAKPGSLSGCSEKSPGPAISRARSSACPKVFAATGSSSPSFKTNA
ncbi:hypothetical protein ACXR8U_26910 [Methylobacterium radiotolerans]|uniref:TniQ family protein n=1 Tax=Methylobacterium TaxID=407 RepID=UPI0005E4D56C|nr:MULTISPECIES: TniQ family protein [Methylobacterium]MBN6819251.1 hypothetical protein [Methylobacterium organophilum]OXE39227.1 hypothetical protein CCS92_25125 [Methylobacterium radiotolerans]GAN49077.1 hypothetical protein ME121_3099 [Methylobacterium sp. ME121]